MPNEGYREVKDLVLANPTLLLPHSAAMRVTLDCGPPHLFLLAADASHQEVIKEIISGKCIAKII